MMEMYRAPDLLLEMVEEEYKINNRFYRDGANPVVQIDLQAQLVVTRRGIYCYSLDCTGRPYYASYKCVGDDNKHFGARVSQMYSLAKRLLELNTSTNGNVHRAYIYNQRRRELSPLIGVPTWWSAPYETNSYLLPPDQPAPSIYFHR